MMAILKQLGTTDWDREPAGLHTEDVARDAVWAGRNVFVTSATENENPQSLVACHFGGAV